MKWALPKGAPLTMTSKGEVAELPLIAHIGDPLFGFLVYEEEKANYYVNLTVTEVIGVTESTPEVLEQEHYLSCYIKWDGCSHFYFGDIEDEDGESKPSGYLHLCGADAISNHAELLRALFVLAFARMGRELP